MVKSVVTEERSPGLHLPSVKHALRLVRPPWERLGEGMSEVPTRAATPPRVPERPPPSFEMRREHDADTVGWSRRTWGDESVTWSSGMSQVEGFKDNVRDITAAQPFMALAEHPRMPADPTAPEHKREGTQTAAPHAKRGEALWPRWPKRWPDGSLPTISGGWPVAAGRGDVTESSDDI